MTAKLSGSRRGRVELSQRAWSLPDGSPAGWWSLAPTQHPGGDRAAREAAREIPAEHREAAWLIDDSGAAWWAVLDTRTDRAAYASLRDLPGHGRRKTEISPEPEKTKIIAEPVAAMSAPAPATVSAPAAPAPIPNEETTMDASRKIAQTLAGFDIRAEVEAVQRGAAVERYLLKLMPGTPVANVTKRADDLALALGADHVRVYPAGGHVAVEIPAAERRTVPLSDLSSAMAQDHPLRVPIGVAVDGSGVSARLDKLPHLLVAGTTGSGKSTAVTAMLAHLVTHAEPANVQLALVDPKRVELAPFARLPHLLAPVATDVAAAVALLDELVEMMEARYSTLEQAGRRNIAELDDRPPYVLLVVDELADLILTGGKRIEAPLVRLLQLGRAAGIHAILATQRPSAEILTGLIRTNVPSRLVFAVQSHTDSGIALGQSGAEKLLGQGDALYWPSGASAPERLQAPYVATDDLEAMLTPLTRHSPAELARMDAARPEPGETLQERNERVREAMLARLRTPADIPEPTEEPPASPAVATPEESTLAEEPATYAAPARLPTEEVEELLESAYYKGRAHGEMLANPSYAKRRPVLAADVWLAVLVFLAVTLGAFLMLPLAPLVIGAAVAAAVTRRRTLIQYNMRSGTICG